MFKKFKSFIEDDVIYGAILLVLVGVGSFGLGRLSVEKGTVSDTEAFPRVQLLASSTLPIPATSTFSTQNAAAVITAPAVHTGSYVASKSGSKYYLTSCSGAKRIKEENKVFFTTVHDAAAAGYEPATNCPGL